MMRLILLSSLLCCSLHAELGELNNAPLQAEPVQMFIRLLGDVRSATPQSGVAKAQALRLFNRLYERGSHQMHELLGAFVTNLQQLLDNRTMLSSTKDRSTIMLLEETKHLLIEISAHTLPSDNKELCGELMHQLYIALNPTFGDQWRKWRKIGGGILTTAIVGTVLFACWRIYRGITRVSNAQGQWGQFVEQATALIKYNLKPREEGEVYLGEQLAHTLQKLQEPVNLQDPAALAHLMQHGSQIEQLVASFNYMQLADAHAKANGDTSKSTSQLWGEIIQHAITEGEDSPLLKFLPQIGKFLASIADETAVELAMTSEQRAARQRTANENWSQMALLLAKGEGNTTAIVEFLDQVRSLATTFTGSPPR